MLLALAHCVIAVVAAPADPAPSATARAVVVPLEVVGELEPGWRRELDERVRAGLERGDAEIVEARETSSCRDPSCWRDEATVRKAGFVVLGTVTIVERDYGLHMEVRSARDGAVVVRMDQRCELCGIGEAAGQLSDMAAAVADKLDALATAPAVLAIESVPSGAEIAIDGNDVGEAPLVREVAPGSHGIAASLAGYRKQTRSVEAAAGVQQLVRFELLAAQDPRKHLRRFGWAALALGAVGIVAGASLVAIDERPVTGRCTGENVNAFGVCKYRHATLAGGAVLIGVGVAAVITGTVIAVARRPRAASSPRRRSR